MTVGQDFDILLTAVLDKFLQSNKIERLSLKSGQVCGEMASGAILGMILKTIAEAL
ncbi:MAG: hypothetical protein HYX22_02085 [Candidatus Yanofskybacteria bacterium]|nr:hypothetical protein [Candidatus Yanofskybacteria bacterium]